MRYFLAIALAAVLSFAFGSGFGYGQQRQTCFPLQNILKVHKQRYQEVPIMRGVSQGGKSRVLILANQQKSTYTLLLVYPNGMACPKNAGYGFEIFRYKEIFHYKGEKL